MGSSGWFTRAARVESGRKRRIHGAVIERTENVQTKKVQSRAVALGI
jgi:hypothetical protein